MKCAAYTGWFKGESVRVLPNIELDNTPDSFYISLAWLKWIISIGIETED